MATGDLRPGTIVGNRYRIDHLLGQGGLGRVYLAQDLQNGEARVALKLLASGRPGDLEVNTLKQEFSLLSRLRHPNLVRILDFGLFGEAGNPFLAEEFTEGENLFAASRNWDANEVLLRIAALCQAIQFLHSRNIIHRDLKPTNILVPGTGAGSDDFKVLDFGLAQWAGSGKPNAGVGTLAYTAPEILLGMAATPRSDLYSIGILLYQLLLGRLPFEDEDPGFLIQKQIQGHADLRPLVRLEHGAALAQVVGSLLEKDPSKRPSTAEDLIRFLGVAAGRDFQHSSTAAVESYFSSVPLVGRDRELSLLLENAGQVRANGRGRTIFIIGEGGAGKSRIMEELRIHCLLDGWDILEAGCRLDDSRSYAPFREVLYRSDRLARAASQLPGGEEIFRFEEAPRVAEEATLATPNDAAAGRFRDLLTREMVRRLQGRPTILLLHDFHWADEATVTVLDYLSSDIQSHPILLCVSLRPIEAPQSPLARLMDQAARQHRAETLALEHLSKDLVEQFIRSAINEADLAAEIAGWAYSSSGGNPFCLEEILKHLVDRGLLRRDRGRWALDHEKWESLEVPASVAVVLRQRLAQLSIFARELTEWFAVYNRAASVRLLKQFVAPRREDLEVALRELVERQIIREITQDGEDCYEFRHAMISEVIRGDLHTRRRRQMHRFVGEVLEAQEGARGRLLELAHHLTEGNAGEKAVRYALDAAAASKAEFAHETALHFYEYVLAHGNHLKIKTLSEVAIEASDAYCSLGRPRRAIIVLRDRVGYHRSGERPWIPALVMLKLAYAYECVGDLREADRTALRGLHHIDRVNQFKPRIVGEIAATRAGLLTHRAFCFLCRSRTRQGLKLLEQAVEVLSGLGVTQLLGKVLSQIAALRRIRCDLQGARSAGLKAVEVLEQIRYSHDLSVACSHLGMSFTALGRFAKALIEHERAAVISERTRSAYLQTQALSNLAECMCRSGRPEPALTKSIQATRIANESSNTIIEHEASATLAEIQICLGQYDAAYSNLQHLLQFGSSIALISKAHGVYLSAWLAVECGDWDRGLCQLSNLRGLGSVEAPVYEAELGGILSARIQIYRGKPKDALKTLNRLNTLLSRKHWPYQLCAARLSLAEALLLASKKERARKAARDALRLARAMPAIHLQAHAHLLLARAVGHGFFATQRTSSSTVGPPSTVSEVGSHLEKALELAQSAGAKELLWRIHLELAKLGEMTGDPVSARSHAKEALEGLASLESRVPPEMLKGFRAMPERTSARTTCESMITSHAEEDKKHQGLTVGELDNQHLRTLYRAGTLINQIRDLDPLLQTIIDLLLEAIGTERSIIFLKDAVTGNLRFAKGRNVQRETLEKAERISKSVLEQVHEQGRPFVSADAQSDSRVAERDSVLSYQLRTLLCAPLTTGGSTVGCLYTDHPSPFGTLKESTINLFAAFCNLAAAAIENALIHRRLSDEKTLLEKRLRQVREGYGGIIGTSEAMVKLLQRIASIAASPLDVLVTGESGTGKELVARALHRSGKRASGKFLAIDCGSLSDTLVESELFGYRKGAFTGATESRPGLFEAAQGGILFLDEISNLSPKLQGKLLRVLQEREIRRLGETEPRKIDVRIIAATNKDPKQEAERGQFRKDLYYRLNPMEIRVPPLRERVGDIPLLLDWFLARTEDAEGGHAKAFSAEALQLLCDYHYPGNVRELKQIVEGSYYLAPGAIIGVEHLPVEICVAEESQAGSSEDRVEALRLYRRIARGEGTFDGLVKRPFLKREIGSPCLRGVIHLALQKANGRYREAFRLLKVPDKEYTAMMIFLRRHACYLNYRLYRRKRPPE